MREMLEEVCVCMMLEQECVCVCVSVMLEQECVCVVRQGCVWVHSVCQQIWKTQQRPQDWKSSVFIPIPKKVIVKECSNDRTIELISHE